MEIKPWLRFEDRIYTGLKQVRQQLAANQLQGMRIEDRIYTEQDCYSISRVGDGLSWVISDLKMCEMLTVTRFHIRVMSCQKRAIPYRTGFDQRMFHPQACHILLEL